MQCVCESCGSGMIYDFKLHKLKCSYCDTVDNYKIIHDSKDLAVCPNCNGEVKYNDYTIATKCEYCGLEIVFENRTSGDHLPQYIVPAHYDKHDLFELLMKAFSRYICIYTDAFSEAYFKNVIREYIPYWLYSFDVDLLFDGIISKTVGSGNDKSRMSYKCTQQYRFKLQNMPYNASDKMNDSVMYEILPFNYKELEPFEQIKLIGATADTYNHDASYYVESQKKRLVNHCLQFVKDDFAKSINNFDRDSVNLSEIQVQVNNWSAIFVLLPVYVYTYKLQDKQYTYFANAQSGEIVGEPPLNKSYVVQLLFYRLIELGLVLVLMALLLMFLLSL